MLKEMEYGRFALLFALAIANIIIWSGAGHTKAPDQTKHLECRDVSNWKQECYWSPPTSPQPPTQIIIPRYEQSYHYDCYSWESYKPECSYLNSLRYKCMKGYKYDQKLSRCKRKKVLGIF